MTISVDIEGALDTLLSSVSGIPDGRARENVSYAVETDVPYLSTLLSINSQRPATAGSSAFRRHEGFWNVDVVYPASTQGMGTARALADAITAAFQPGQTATQNGVTVRFNYAEQRQASIDSAWVRIPVIISWYCYEA